jgi:hypothetical protein
LLTATSVAAGVPEDIAQLRRPAADPAVNRAAWERLVAAGPAALLPILRAWPADDPVAIHWLRTAFDRIAAKHSAQLPIDDLLQFVKDPTSPGPARRVALAAIEPARPGTTARLLADWLNDPEFGPDAVAERLAAAEAATDPHQSRAILRSTFMATTDPEQAFVIAQKLRAWDDAPDVLRHLGIIRHWQVVGPFPVTLAEGLKQSLPPETKLDFTTSYEGKNGPLRWKAAAVNPNDGRLDLIPHGVNPDDGAVAFAAATVIFAHAKKAEVRASAVDNITLWVNGKKVVERASEYRSLYRPDRYRCSVELPAGRTTLLVKLTKTQPEEVRGKPGAAPKWDFQIRLIDETGRGLTFDQPEMKK